jgi:hypothetical protein
MTQGIKYFKLVVYVPVSHADIVRTAMGACAGALGFYSHCSFSVRGVGRYKPLEGANPFQGTVGVLEQAEEERIEMTVTQSTINAVIDAMKTVHPYEEIAYDIYELMNRDDIK